MKIAIIGAGYAGLAVAFDLGRIPGFDVELIEQEERVSGMAAGFKRKSWDWTLEDHYHHVFDTDKDFSRFVEDLGFSQEVFYQKTRSSTLYQGKFHQLDSPLTLLRFKEIPFLARLRTGAVLAFLKLLPNGVFLERFTAKNFLMATMGKESWEVIWKPLFVSKFGEYYEQINMAWFWARVKPRSQYLGYVKGGFQRLAEEIAKKLQEQGVKVSLGQRLERLERRNGIFQLHFQKKRGKKIEKKVEEYDLVIITLPSTALKKLLPDLPDARSPRLKGLAAMTLLLRSKKPLLSDGTYWLNINEKDWPFVAVVEHDNLVNPRHYGEEYLAYLGRYLPVTDPDYQKSAEELLEDYLPYLEKINPNFAEILKGVSVAKNDFAQPLSLLNYSQVLPKFETGWPNFYWVSLQHVYPYDRGINHAIRIGRELAEKIIEKEL